MQQKRHPRERLITHLKSGSKYPEVVQFKAHCCWIACVGSVEGLEAWVDARIELGLMNTKALLDAANQILRMIAQWDDVAKQERAAAQAKKRIPWDECQRLINQRERQARANRPPVGYHVTRPKPTLKQRMAAAAKLHGFDD